MYRWLRRTVRHTHLSPQTYTKYNVYHSVCRGPTFALSCSRRASRKRTRPTPLPPHSPVISQSCVYPAMQRARPRPEKINFAERERRRRKRGDFPQVQVQSGGAHWAIGAPIISRVHHTVASSPSAPPAQKKQIECVCANASHLNINPHTCAGSVDVSNWRSQVLRNWTINPRARKMDLHPWMRSTLFIVWPDSSTHQKSRQQNGEVRLAFFSMKLFL